MIIELVLGAQDFGVVRALVYLTLYDWLYSGTSMSSNVDN